MPSLLTLGASVLALLPLISAKPLASSLSTRSSYSTSPFSNASWPLPNDITGQSDPGANTTTQGWGGIHIHDPSIILGPDGHYYSFSTHGLIVISRASEPYSLHGYWEIIGSVLEGSSVINNTGSTDPWYVTSLSIHCLNPIVIQFATEAFAAMNQASRMIVYHYQTTASYLPHTNHTF